MATKKNALQELGDGELYLQVTPGRAQAIVEALDIALESHNLDKRRKGTITAMRELLSAVASEQTLEPNPRCSVYVAPDTGPNGESLTKIGHALDVRRRFARNTDRPTPLTVLEHWRFASIAEAMEREATARKKYKTYEGGGGREWVEVNAEKVVDDLTMLWGEPDQSA
jgi:hypothetical protein